MPTLRGSSHGLRRIATAIVRGAIWVVFVLVVLELGFRVASCFAPVRSTTWRAGTTHHILCVGDSHTYGGGVDADQAYPAQLQQILDATAPGTSSVVNLGVPSFSSTQVRNRLAAQIDALRPDVVVVQVGINNLWNTVETTPASWTDQLDALMRDLRVVRFVRVWLHHRDLDSEHDISGNVVGDRVPFHLDATGVDVDWGDEREQVAFEGTKREDQAVAVGHAIHDYEAIVATARAANVRVVLLTYAPYRLPQFAAFNAAMKDVARRTDTPLADAAIARDRLPGDPLTFGAHPGPGLQHEIARVVAAVVAPSPE